MRCFLAVPARDPTLTVAQQLLGRLRESVVAVRWARPETLHLTVQAGANVHHVIEAVFKAFARALRVAVALDPTERGVPSTKGTLV